MPLYATAAPSVDGRPLIEILRLDRNTDGVFVSGTASVFEGTVVIRVRDPHGHERTIVAQASEGGPERGDWQAVVPANSGDLLVVMQQESNEGHATAHLRVIQIRV